MISSADGTREQGRTKQGRRRVRTALKKRVELIVVSDGELEMSRRDSLLPVVLCRSSGELEDLGREVYSIQRPRMCVIRWEQVGARAGREEGRRREGAGRWR
jgi:hypothetical protein